MHRRPGLWVEIALALALITLATILLNAGVFWLLVRRIEDERRLELALALSSVVADQLEVAARQGPAEAGFRAVLAQYQDAEIDLDEMVVLGRQGQVMAALARPRVEHESYGASLQVALQNGEQQARLVGPWWGHEAVVVTTPVAPEGQVVGALRVRLSLGQAVLPGGPATFVLVYTGFSGMAIAIFGFSLFRRRLLAPVERLTEGTHRIAAGEFGHMVKVDAARELQELSGALNTVSASLQAYRQRTREQVERLEQANAELRQAQEALVRSEKLAGLGRLAAGLAHEIGNPLAAVLGYMELLEQGLGDPELERDMLRRAQQELGRIHGILRQLLDYARPGTGRAEEIEVGVALEEAARTVRPQRSFREAELRIHAEEGLPRLLLERDKLHQVLVNLLVNAGHAVAGRPGAAVELRASREGERLRIDCLDNGHGFDSVALDRAFEPFFTTKAVGQGTGLGLATCQRVVEAAGGQVGLANRPEGGAMVSLWLPPAP